MDTRHERKTKLYSLFIKSNDEELKNLIDTLNHTISMAFDYGYEQGSIDSKEPDAKDIPQSDNVE